MLPIVAVALCCGPDHGHDAGLRFWRYLAFEYGQSDLPALIRRVGPRLEEGRAFYTVSTFSARMCAGPVSSVETTAPRKCLPATGEVEHPSPHPFETR